MTLGFVGLEVLVLKRGMLPLGDNIDSIELEVDTATWPFLIPLNQ